MKSLLIFEQQYFGETEEEINDKVRNEHGQNRIDKGIKTSHGFHKV